MTIEPEAMVEEVKSETLSYSEKLTSMVKSNHHQLALEAQLLKAKKHFKKRSKNELIEIFANLIKPEKLTDKRKNGLHNLSKNALIVIVIKQWLERKQEEIRLSKSITEELSNPEVSEVLTDIVNGGTYFIKCELPDTPQWDNTQWESELTEAIDMGAEFLITPSGYRYKINSIDSVTDAPLSKEVE